MESRSLLINCDFVNSLLKNSTFPPLFGGAAFDEFSSRLRMLEIQAQVIFRSTGGLPNAIFNYCL